MEGVLIFSIIKSLIYLSISFNFKEIKHIMIKFVLNKKVMICLKKHY